VSAPPVLLDLHVAAPGHRRVHVWLPLVLLWPLLLLLGAVGVVLAAWVDAVLMITARRRPVYARLLWGLLLVAADTRGLQVKIENADTTVRVTVI
jgi:hypothetical protein